MVNGGTEARRDAKRIMISTTRPQRNEFALPVSRPEMRHFSARSRKSRDCAETYIWYVAQGIPPIDADLPARWQAGIAKKGHFWMETKSRVGSLL